MTDLDLFVEGHLNLQVKISYPIHHDFLLRHKLHECSHVLDVGTGNGTFVARLAHDHPNIKFVGIDKRKQCVESCQKLIAENLAFTQVDMFSQKSDFDFSQYDGFLMRYFLLHVDNSQKILEFLKQKAKRPSKFWVIDLDWSQFKCEPQNESFDKFIQLVKDFCSKISPDSMGGQKVLSLLEKLEFQNIETEYLPFSTKTIPLEELALYMKQEVICYSRMSGRSSNDPDTAEIVKFIDDEVRSGKFQIDYGMILVSAEIEAYDYRNDILALLCERGPEKTICPSEVLSPENKQNKEMMEQVRKSAKQLVSEGKIEITQSGKAVDPNSFKGPIRLRLK